MKKWFLAALFGSVLALSACGSSNDGETGNDHSKDTGSNTEKTATPGSEKVDSAEAEALYASKCSGCHGDDLSGVAAPGLQNVGSKLSKEEIKQIIEKGKGTMPSGIAKGKEAEELAEWLAAKK